jgi:hypothetical protein
MIYSGQVCGGAFVTKDATGALSPATVGPVGQLWVNGVVNAAVVTITGANPYKWVATMPTLTAGAIVQMYITATVDGVATASFIWVDGEGPAIVWANATRTLTQAASSAIAALTGSTLGIVAHITYATTLSGLTIPATWTKIWLSIKSAESDADSASVIQIVESNPGVGTDGLLYLNATAATAGQASLTVDQAAGTIAIVIADEATTLLAASTYGYDVKCLLADGTTQQLTHGMASITLTETRALV